MQFNRLEFGGDLTRDAELQYFQNGGCVAKFGMANNRRHKNRDTGEVKEYVTFVECEMYGPMAETFIEYFGEGQGKGKAVFIEGELEQQRWDDKDTGEGRSKLVVRIAYPKGGWHFVGSRGESDGEEQQQGGGQQQSASTSEPTMPDDIPF